MTGRKTQAPQNNFHIPAKSGTAFSVMTGQTLRVIDMAGEQVADLFCVASKDTREYLSSGHTTDYNSKLFLSTGDSLFSNHSRPMLTITTDRVGRHIMLYAPCSQAMFEKSYGAKDPHPNCQDNLATALSKFGVPAEQITIPFNIFMNIEIDPAGLITIQPPRSQAGDYIELSAEMDLIVGVSACSAGLCNNFHWSPIEIEIY